MHPSLHWPGEVGSYSAQRHYFTVVFRRVCDTRTAFAWMHASHGEVYFIGAIDTAIDMLRGKCLKRESEAISFETDKIILWESQV